MNEQEMLLLLEAAQRQLEAGMPMHVLNERIRRETGGTISGYMSLQLAIPTDLRRTSDNEAIRAAAGDEAHDNQLTAFGTAGPVQHFLESMAQGASLGFGNEIMDVLGNEGYGERLEARRELNPGAAMVGEMAGLFVPGAATARAVRGATAGQGFLASTARGAGLLGAEGALAGAGEGEGLGGRARGAAAGGLIGGALGGAGQIAGRAAVPFRSNKAKAGTELRGILDQTGRTMSELFDEVRAFMRKPGLRGVATLADVDPSIGARAPALVKLAPGIRAAGGPLEALRVRVEPGAIRAAEAKIWKAFDGTAIDDKTIIQFIRKNPAAREAARDVVKGNIDALDSLPFEEVQDIIRRMGRRGGLMNEAGLRSGADKVFQSKERLIGQLERVVPGYEEANRVWSDMLTRTEGAERLIQAIDRANPTFSPDVPSTIGDMSSQLRRVLANPAKRREAIARLVGDAILTEGEDGIKMIEDLVKRGLISQLFRGAQTPAAGAVAVPGLLAGQSQE